MTFFQGNKKQNDCKVWLLKSSPLLRYRGNCDYRKWPVKFRDLRETGPWTELFRAELSPYPFALVTRRLYCPERPKKLCFTTPSLTPMVSTARLGVVRQSFFGLPGQYGRRVTRANELVRLKRRTCHGICFEWFSQLCTGKEVKGKALYLSV